MPAPRIYVGGGSSLSADCKEADYEATTASHRWSRRIGGRPCGPGHCASSCPGVHAGGFVHSRCIKHCIGRDIDGHPGRDNAQQLLHGQHLVPAIEQRAADQRAADQRAADQRAADQRAGRDTAWRALHWRGDTNRADERRWWGRCLVALAAALGTSIAQSKAPPRRPVGEAASAGSSPSLARPAFG